jgi:hypothetical protein
MLNNSFSSYYAGGCQYSTTGLGMVQNISYNTYVYTVRETCSASGWCYSQVKWVYSDGTSTNGTLAYGTSVDQLSYNPNPSKIVSNIEYYSCDSYIGYAVSYAFNTSYYDGLSSFTYNISLLSYNLSINQYLISVDELNYSGNFISETNSSLFNVTANAILNISAYSVLGSSFSFNLTVIGTTNVSYSSVNNVVSLPIIRGSNYSFYLYNSSYIPTISNYSANSSIYQYLSIVLVPSNTLNLTLYDEVTNTLIIDRINITITDITNPYIVITNTSSGNAIIQYLPTDDVLELKFTSDNYTSSRNYVIILLGSSTNLRVYLLRNDVANNLSICWYDSNGVPIYGLHAYQWHLANTSYILTQDVYSDIQGKTNFIFSKSYYYYYNFSSAKYGSYPFILNPPSNSAFLADGCNYDITLFTSTTSYNFLTNVTGYASYNNVTKILSFNYTSYDMSIGNYTFNVTKIINGQEYTLCSNLSTLTSDTFTCDLSGYYGIVFVKGNADGKMFYSGYISIAQLPRLFDNLTREDAAFWTGLIMTLIIFAGITFGILGTLILGVFGLVAIFWIGIMTPVTLTLIIVDIVVSLVIALGLRRWN